MAIIVITGGTGLVGSALTKTLLASNHHVIILTRNKNIKRSHNPLISYAHWNVEKQKIDSDAISKADYIIHLAGANVAEARWTNKRKKEILESRVLSGQLIAQSLQQIPNQVKAIISASAIGWYGPDQQIPNHQPFKEEDPAHPSFLGTTCLQWEQAIQPVTALGKRLVTLRIGIVLSNEGGAYAEFRKPMEFGVASVLGNGKQVISWIHISDLVHLITYAMQHEHMSGVYNAVAPHPVNNKTLIKEMAKVKRGFTIQVPVPELALKVMLGEMSIEVLKSTTVSSVKLQSTGFFFFFPTIQTAVADLEKRINNAFL